MNRKPREDTEEIEEETDYVNEPVCTVEKVAAPPDYRFRFFTQSFPLIAVCWLILLVIMGLRIHFTSVIPKKDAKLTAEIQSLKTQIQQLNTSDLRELNQLKENQTALLDANHNLINNNNKLSSDIESLKRDHKNLTVQFDNLIQGFTVLESQIISLTAENQQLNTSNQELNTSNQELEAEKNNLTEQIRDMETNWNELNVSRAQWSIDNYCPKTNNERQCKVCQDNWLYNNPSCYGINNAASPKRRTWEEAREDCKGKNSDFTVIHDQNEKDLISSYSWGSSGTNGYWIGLRVENGKWKWIDGTDLTVIYWEQPPPPTPPTVGHCAISFEKKGWKSVSCDVRQQWICKKNALSL